MASACLVLFATEVGEVGGVDRRIAFVRPDSFGLGGIGISR